MLRTLEMFYNNSTTQLKLCSDWKLLRVIRISLWYNIAVVLFTEGTWCSASQTAILYAFMYIYFTSRSFVETLS